MAQVNENRYIPASWGHVEANHYPVELEIMPIYEEVAITRSPWVINCTCGTINAQGSQS